MTHELLTLLWGAAPLTEVRYAIPLAVKLYGISPGSAYFFAAIGNILPIIPLLLFWHFLVEKIRHRFYWCDRLFARLFEFTKARHEHRFRDYVHRPENETVDERRRSWKLVFILFLFVAIPLPMTGAWTGTLVAYMFGIPFWRSLLALFLGIAASGFISYLVTVGFIHLFL